MHYRLIVSPKAFAALNSFVDYIAIEQQAPLTAQRWLQKALDKLRTLKQFPHRCPPALENDNYKQTVRALIVNRCMFLYCVDEANQAVRVLSFRHDSQLPEDLDLEEGT